MTIKIVLPEGEGSKPCNGTKVFTESGSEIEGVSRIKIEIMPNCMLQAEMTVELSSIENLNGLEGIVIIDRKQPDQGAEDLTGSSDNVDGGSVDTN